jgi:uncharacterized glyoxalase superfamily protein PhnB
MAKKDDTNQERAAEFWQQRIDAGRTQRLSGQQQEEDKQQEKSEQSQKI